MSNRMFFYPDYRRYVLFTSDALNHMYAHAQRWPWSKEAGGEIYSPAPFDPSLIISSATGPSTSDVRKRHLFNPDIESLTRDRNLKFDNGEHVVGLWHTHPQSTPSPSYQDQETAEVYLNAFNMDRNRYLLVIIGNMDTPLSMAVWIVEAHVPRSWFRLMESRI